MKRINQTVYANIIAGVSAAIIFLGITLATGGSAARAILGGLLLGVVTFAIAFLITQAVTRAKQHAP